MSRHHSSSIRSRKVQPQSPVPNALAKPWNRSDKISAFAMVFAAAAAVAAYQAETRVRKTEWREVEAVAIAVGRKVRLIANSAEQSAQFMQGFVNHRESNPKGHDQIDAYIIELAGSPELPELAVQPEQLAALARANGDAAGMLASCADRRADMEIDSKKFTDARPGRLTHMQLSTARVMPYRLRELSEACKASLNALVTLVPQLPKIMGPIRGTIGELMEAGRSSNRDREKGIHVELHLGERKLRSEHVISSVMPKKTAVATDPRDE